MTQILKAFMPLKPTKAGLAAVKSEAYRTACRNLMLSAFIREEDELVWQSRLNLLTLETLLPKYAHNSDDCETYLRAHVHEVYGYWHAAVADLYRRLAADPKGTLTREFGIVLPAEPAIPVTAACEYEAHNA